MTIAAFAYAGCLETLAPLYYGLATDMVSSVKAHMPGIDVVQISDLKTEEVSGISGIMRIDRIEPLMVWRMKAHQLAHSLSQQIIFIEPDVRFRASVLGIFDDTDFDVAITEREVEVEWDGEMLSDIAPFTLGCTFSRSASFWRDAKMHCRTLSDRQQNWIGDMISIAAAAKTGKYKIKLLPGPEYNHVPASPDDVHDEMVKVLHYKGKRKRWLFNTVREAA
jgi:hypothetical protein